MAQYGLPYVLEDKTGLYNSTEYDDIYDRMFIGITSTANVDAKPTGSSTVKIFELGSRTSLHAYPSTYPGRDPTVILDFGPNSHLGTILFVKRSMSMPMSSWIKKTSFFGRSLSRKFLCSDGLVYTWSYRSEEDAEWTCMAADSEYTVARYTLKPPGEPTYRSTGHSISVEESYGHLAVELVSALTIMRHIQKYNL